MPYCGRCLNVGRAGKRGVRHQNTAQFNLDSGVLLRQAQPTPNGASRRFAGSRRSWTSHRVNTWTRAVGRSFAGSILLSRLAKTHPAINWLQTVGTLERQHPPWILTEKSADLIQVPKLVLGQCAFDRRESVLTLVEAFAAMMTEVTTGFANRRGVTTRRGRHGCRPMAVVRRGTKPPSIGAAPRRARRCGRRRPRCWSGSPLDMKRTQGEDQSAEQREG
jgi:hypothetical protein